MGYRLTYRIIEKTRKGKLWEGMNSSWRVVVASPLSWSNIYPQPNSCCLTLRSPSTDPHSEARGDLLLDPSIDTLWATWMALGHSRAGGKAEPQDPQASYFEAQHIKKTLKWHWIIQPLRTSCPCLEDLMGVIAVGAEEGLTCHVDPAGAGLIPSPEHLSYCHGHLAPFVTKM